MIPEKQTMVNMEEFYRKIKNIWNSIYPIYFDSTKSLAQGRRVPKELAVPTPVLEELSYAVGLCKIKNIIEPHKVYPRDIFERGRLKVEIFDKDGNPMNPQIKSKKKLLIEIAKKLKEIRSNIDKK